MLRSNPVKILLFAMIAGFFCGSDCSVNRIDCHSSVNIANYSNQDIYFSIVYDSALANINYPPGASASTYKCSANSGKTYNTFGCLEGQISQAGNLYVFIFDAAVIESLPWDSVKQRRLFLQRYNRTVSELSRSNWFVDYP